MKSKKIIVALDNSDLKKVKKIVSDLKSEAFAFKIGYEFFLNNGISGYKEIKKICPNIFLDLKLHDIPNTVQKGLEAIYKLKPILSTVHISGGDDMMRVTTLNRKHTKILGVTILTSLDSRQTKKYYNEKNLKILIQKFVKEAKKFKLDGVVCSPKEIKYIRELVGKNFLIVTPGIRIKSSQTKKDDQKRILSPSRAIDLGANYLVIGRPILNSKNPLNTLRTINSSLN